MSTVTRTYSPEDLNLNSSVRAASRYHVTRLAGRVNKRTGNASPILQYLSLLLHYNKIDLKTISTPKPNLN